MKSQRFEVEVEQGDVIMIVEGEYYEGVKSNDYDVPDDEPIIDIEHIWVGDQDISGLIEQCYIDSIEQEVFDKLK
jgi:hypothetical protein